MKPTLADIASLAEIVASIGVVLSLIFVGFQISDANNEARAATIQASADSRAYISATFANHADTWDRVLVGGELVDGELRKGILLFNLVMTELENQFHQYQSGYLDESGWAARRSSLKSIVALPIFQDWRNTPGGYASTREFLALVDQLAAEVQHD